MLCVLAWLGAAGEAGAQGRWDAGAPMPTARSGLVTVGTPNGLLYAIGGFNPHLSPQYRDDCEVYDPSRRSWSFCAPMPTARSAAAAALGQDGRIYVMGGTDTTEMPVDTLEAYDPASDSWSRLAPMPMGGLRSRWGLAAATAPNGRIYAIGGSAGTGPLAYVDIYDPATNVWTIGPELPFPFRAYYLAATLGPDGRIYAMGGLDGVDYHDEAFALDIVTGWTAVPRLPERRALFTAVARGDRIYISGGGNELGPLSVTAAYVPSLGSWTTAPTPLPNQRISAAGALGAGGRIYVIGGARSTPLPIFYSHDVQSFDADGMEDADWLRPIDCIQESTLRSESADTAASIQFINNTTLVYHLYWRNYDGQRLFWDNLAPGAAFRLQTFLTHPWVVTDRNERCVGIYRANPTPGRAEVELEPPELTNVVACQEEPNLRSVSSTFPTSLQFINKSNDPIRVYWLNFVGERVLYATLNAGQGVRQATFVTHPWLLTDLTDTCRNIYLPISEPTRVTIP